MAAPHPEFAPPQHSVPPHMLLVAVAGEGGMALGALAAGWLFGLRPLESLRWSPADLALGLGCGLPPLLLLIPCARIPWRPFQHLFQVLEEFIVPIFSPCSLLDFAMISATAGLGEELLFRGIVQAGLAELVGPAAGLWVGLLGAALLFGLLHWITHLYALLAGLIGLFLGWLWLASGNLLVPIAAHAAYDFLALLYLVRIRRTRIQGPGRSVSP